MNKSVKAVFIFFLLYPCLAATTFSQQLKEVTELIVQKDSLFWQAYNTCATEKLPEFVAKEVEFYHDKGGLTLGVEDLVSSVKKNLCGPDYRLRREAVPGTVRIYPMVNNKLVYGAIICGDHYFYVNVPGKPERRDGLAKFFNIWLLKDSSWKMERVVSYDHGPAPYVNLRKEVKISEMELNSKVGTYLTEKGEKIIIAKEKKNGLLLVKKGANTFLVYPESKILFFVRDQDLTFEFSRTGTNGISTLVLRKNGEIAEKAMKK